MKPGQIVWARDPEHNHYLRWGKGIYVKPLDNKHVVQYIMKNGEPSPICGKFPEVREDEPSKEEQLTRINL